MNSSIVALSAAEAAIKAAATSVREALPMLEGSHRAGAEELLHRLAQDENACYAIGVTLGADEAGPTRRVRMAPITVQVERHHAWPEDWPEDPNYPNEDPNGY